MSGNSKQRLLKELRNKDARHVFVEEHARTGPAYQIKAMRDARGWSQEKLGQELGSEPQSTISRWENPDYGRFTIGTLLRVAAAFDVALMVRFVGVGELVNKYSDLTPEALNAPSFKSDTVIFDMTIEENPALVPTRGREVVGNMFDTGYPSKAPLVSDDPVKSNLFWREYV